jgi:GT2 family glycosyltransferase/lipopolysaccharide/colanic/teichoic acid biosynthesis glycosyltransferase
MQLSIVIVNYNVKYFLEQCLNSVRKATEGIQAEVFVVDNNSVDSSCTMVKEKFPEVKLIENKENLGFSRANNQAIRLAKGNYVLLLNPDTVVEDDTFSKVLVFMEKTPDSGGLGVKMIDGKGNFLPESKRGLPTPAVAFYKIFGLSKFFPKSKIFGRYHLGYLDNEQVHEVDVLSGAFMLLRKSALDMIGLLDEEFFMYGEDIDLSYRITKGGYKNYYYPETRIIHYKGESTKKGSVNYVLVFYNAMIIFAKKHFTQKNARTLSLLIRMAIYFRALVAILNRFVSRAFLPFLDILLIYTGIFFIKTYWENRVIFLEGGNYPALLMTVIVPIYIFIWLISNYLAGVYDRPVRLRKLLQGFTFGTIFILVVYALLPENLRISRAIIIFGATWGIISMTGLRLVLNLLKVKGVYFGAEKNRRFAIVGDEKEAKRVAELLQTSNIKPGFTGLISTSGKADIHAGFLGNLAQIKEIIMIYRIDEVIFCAKSISHQAIMDQMSNLQGTGVDYKIAPEDSLSIIGSNSINTSGDLYTVNINAINSNTNKRNKRFLDLAASQVLLILSPILLFIVRRPFGFIGNIFLVFFGQRSWVGYVHEEGADPERLPKIRKGILTPLDAFSGKPLSIEMQQQLNVVYARDYNLKSDVNIILKRFRELGRRA